MKAIIYTSNTGYTEKYAKMLAKKCNLPIYTLAEAEKSLPAGSDIIYMGWLMAGRINEYNKATKLFNIKAVCAVGLCDTGSLINETRKNNDIPESTVLFTLQGGYAPEKLKGMYKFIMKIVTKVLIKKIDSLASPTEGDKAMKSTLQTGGSFVCEDNLRQIVDFIQQTKNPT